MLSPQDYFILVSEEAEMKNQKRLLFKELMEKRKSFGKLILLPISFILHSLVILTLVIYPMVSTGKMPEIKSFSVKLFSMPKLVTPGIKSGTNRGRKGSPVKSNNLIQKKISNMIAPLDIPDEIEEPDIFSENPGKPGVDGGVDPDFLDTVGDPFGDDNGDLFSSPVSMVMKNPRLIKKVSPFYPSLALKARREGNIILEAVTDIYGKVVNVRIISGDFLLNEAAINAIKQWIYEPYIINGMPKPVKFTVTISFRLKR